MKIINKTLTQQLESELNTAEQQVVVLQARKLARLREQMATLSYLSVKQVMAYLNLSRQVVESLPIEILPYQDYGSGSRALRRYHPADVEAAGVRIRGWRWAQQEGHGEEYLRKLRHELEERDRGIFALAHLLTGAWGRE
jgi:anion-transporting  ArsA/GET3 family ATPase